MPEFWDLTSPDKARDLFSGHLPNLKSAVQVIQTVHSLGRVTAEDIRAPHPLPEFPRSSMDGYAVRAGDTPGASDAHPVSLSLIGEVMMGKAAGLVIKPGQCALIHTGGMLPEGADAVVRLEDTATAGAAGVKILRAVEVDGNVLRAGEDVTEGEIVIPAGRRIRPAEIGGLMALGITRLRVAARPRIGILSSGDEIVPPHRRPRPGQVRDINSHSLAALVSEAGGEPVLYGIIPDDPQVLRKAATHALAGCAMLLITAGSSVSARDATPRVIQSLGAPGILVHGINIRPGKPTVLAVCDGKPVVGLPGNPVSALVVARLFVAPVIGKMLGLPLDKPGPSVRARLAADIPAQDDREAWIPVRLLRRSGQADLGAGDEPLYDADPVLFKSNFIFSLAAADGLLHIPAGATSLQAGKTVLVSLL
jgi:molybdopterin molybdotransferase